MMAAHVTIWLAGLCLMAVLSTSASIAFAGAQRSGSQKSSPTTMPSPNPALPPKDVARIVIEALGKNDANDSGIRTTWNFASPGNKEETGPLERFIPMVKSPDYQPMLNHKSAKVRELVADDEHAAELVIVTDANGDKAYYIFQLTRQTDGDVKDCWMTDGVVRIEPDHAPAAAQPQQRRHLPDGTSPA